MELFVDARTHLNKPGCNSSKTALTTQVFFLCFCDDGLCMLGLGGCEAGEVSTGAATAAAAAFLGDIAAAPGSDIVVGNVAAVGGLVPKLVAIDGCTGRLTGDCNVRSFIVALDYGVRGSWARAAVDGVASDGVGIDDWSNGGKCER